MKLAEATRGKKGVTLKKESEKEASKDDLLRKVAEERAARAEAKKRIRSACVIQSRWRGKRVFDSSRAEVKRRFSAVAADFLIGIQTTKPPQQHKEADRQGPADDVSSPCDALRAVLFCLFLPRTKVWQVREDDRAWLAVSLKLLLASLASKDPRINPHGLAAQSQSFAATWRYQVKRLVSLTSFLLSQAALGQAAERRGGTLSGANSAAEAAGSTAPTTAASVAAAAAAAPPAPAPVQISNAQLAIVALRLMLTLTDQSTNSSSLPAATSPSLALSPSPPPLPRNLLLHCLCESSPSFFASLSSLVLRLCPTPEASTHASSTSGSSSGSGRGGSSGGSSGSGSSSSSANTMKGSVGSGRPSAAVSPNPALSSEHLLLLAAAFNLALKPLTAGAAPAAPTASAVVVQDQDLTSLAARQLASHVLSIPLLTWRLPPPLVPALRHASVLLPLLRCYQTLNPSSREPRRVEPGSRGEGKSDETPSASCISPSLASLANLLSLAAGEGTGALVATSSSILNSHPAAYAAALQRLVHDCQLSMQASDPVEEEDETCHPLLRRDISILYDREHVLLLLKLAEGAANVDSKQDADGCGQRRGTLVSNGRAEGTFGLPEFCSLYTAVVDFLLVQRFTPMGVLSLLNALAFSPSFLKLSWQWLQQKLDSVAATSSSVFATSASPGAGQVHEGKGLAERGKGKGGSKTPGEKFFSFLGSMENVFGGDKSKEGKGAEDDGSGLRGQESASAVLSENVEWNVRPVIELIERGRQESHFSNVLALFSAAYAHLLLILDDEEFFEKQHPFSLDQQRQIAATLNTFVYNSLVFCPKTPSRDQESPVSCQARSSPHFSQPPPLPSTASFLLSSAEKCLHALHDRSTRRSFCPPSLWLAPAVARPMPRSHLAADMAVSTSASSSSLSATSPTLLPGPERRVSSSADGSSVLRSIPHVLPFETRVAIFREIVRSDKQQRGIPAAPAAAGGAPTARPAISLLIRRRLLVEDAFAQLANVGQQLKGRVHVTFVAADGREEPGMDAGGLFKEFITDVAKAVLDPRFGLFMQTNSEQGLLYPNPAAKYLPHGLPMVRFLGSIVGKALYEGILLEMALSPPFLRRLMGRPASLDEISAVDPELHRNLLFLKRYEGDAGDLALDFTLTEDVFGQLKTFSLCPDGASVPVMNENKLQYIHSVADFNLNTKIRPLVAAFVEGLSAVVPLRWLQMFDANELNQLLSGGTQDFDVSDLRKHTVYKGGYSESDRAICHFWDVVSALTPAERCELLKFVTSCSRPPLLGFKYLHPPFTIQKMEHEGPSVAPPLLLSIFGSGGSDISWLPSAATCYNTLKLPPYRKAATMREKLKYAIKSNSGFELS